MAHADRFAWLRRDGAPLVASLVLHMLALVLIAPWLVMRTIPAPQVEVEVMLEEDVPEPPSSRPEKALRLRDLVKVQRPQTRSVRPQRVQLQATQTQPLQSSLSRIELPQPSDAPAAQAGQGQTGQSAPAPREIAGLSAPSAPGSSPSAPPAAAPASPGEAAQRDGMQAVNQAVPSTPSLGSTPQPSSPAAAAPSRAGLDRQDGPTTLAGQAPQAQAAEPEFRQAARQGGQASMRGGSQAPEDGLARQQGAADQTALFASRSAPQSVTGGSAAPGGRPPALAAPAVRGSGRGSVAAAETAAPAHLAQPAPSAGGAGIAPGASRTPAPSAQGNTPGGRGSVAAAEPASATGLSPFAGSGSGQGVPSASRAPAPSGRGSSGSGTGSLAAVPGEHGNGLMAAAAPGTAGPGTATRGAGPGASAAGEGRAQPIAGAGSAARETAAAPLLAAGGGPSAAPVGADGGIGQLSARTRPVAPTQPLHETPAAPLQTQRPTGQARVIEERFTATALKVDSPRTICELPLMFAGFDRKPIPQGLDSINATAARLADETPPRHHPGNQAPRYPMQALGMRAEGRVLVRAEIRPDGTIGQQWVKQTSGVPILDLAALETVRGWHFYPAQRHGLAVAVWMDVPIEYKLP